MQPVSNGAGRDRKLLGEASRLLAEAGWKRQGSLVQNEKGERLVLEILVNDEVFVRVDSPFVENMRAVGIDASIRQVDPAQYAVRQNDFDFDVMSLALNLFATPTYDTLENIFHSRAATVSGSRNLPGTASPAVDKLIAIAGNAKSRQELDGRAACARPGLARAHGLDSKLVFGESPGRVLGHVRLRRAETGLRLPDRDDVVVRQGQGGGDWQGLKHYLAKRRIGMPVA